MKKWIAATLLLLLAGITCLYLFVPTQRKVSNTVVLKANSSGILRQLANQASWQQWWPRTTAINAVDAAGNIQSYIYNSHEYSLLSVASNSVDIGIQRGEDTLITTLLVMPLGIDSTLLNWQYTLQEKSWDPFQRIRLQNRHTRLQESIEPVFERLWLYMEKPENLYGIRVQLNKVTDTMLITTKDVFDHEPNTPEIYSMIHQLQSYCNQQGAQQSGFPMLNIRREDSSHFEAMVAIPVNTPLPNQGRITFKRMFAGNILVTEVVGGPQRIKEAFEQLQVYMQDYEYQPPVIPFESLITDRSRETDTAKWVTKIYFPVL